MRQVLLVCLTFLLSIPAFAQKPKQSIGLYSSFLKAGSPITFGKSGSSRDITHSFRLGTEYSYHLTQSLIINAGVEYSNHEIKVSNTSLHGSTDKYGPIQFISVPIYLSAERKYFFFTFGTIVDFQLKNDMMRPVSNFAITGGVGIKHDFKNNLRIFVHPFYQWYGLSSGNNLLIGSIRTGISYRF